MLGFPSQDSQLNILRAELSDSQNKKADSDRRLDELSQQVQQLKDQNALLKAHRGDYYIQPQGLIYTIYSGVVGATRAHLHHI